MRKYLLSVLATALLAFGLIGPTVSAGTPAGANAKSAMTPAQRLARGPLTKNPSRYARLKAQANLRAAAASEGATRTGPTAPGTFIQWDGLEDNQVTPPDPTGAVGPTRYVELVNLIFGIYDRTGTLLSTGSLNQLAGRPDSDFIFDPQVIWDPQTQRFYYVAADAIDRNFTNTLLAFGWSKTGTPTSPADFCHFAFDWPGDDLPDYPKLGDSQNWMLVGVNTFSPNFFVSADVMWFKKPPAGEACNAPQTGIKFDLRDQTGTQTSTPVPAQSTDVRTALLDGAIISNDPFDGGEQNFLTRFLVSDSVAGPIIENPGRSIPIPNYTIPANADQPGLPASLDTLDARLTQAVSARDPRLGRTSVWTQHTVGGGGGAEVRWYEVDPRGAVVLQSGVATNPSLDVFNGAVSPDRANNGVTQAYGSNMVMGFNTSSSTEFTKIQMVSKIGAGAQSAFVLVKASPGENFDNSCCPNRWGDYASATPDPAAPQGGTAGAVWLSNMWNDDSPPGDRDKDWRTWNWGVTP